MIREPDNTCGDKKPSKWSAKLADKPHPLRRCFTIFAADCNDAAKINSAVIVTLKAASQRVVICRDVTLISYLP